MKLFLFALATTCFSMATKAQDCRGALMQGIMVIHQYL